MSDATTTKIECLVLKRKEAVVVAAQHYVRTVPDRKDGSPHELITNVRHKETWVYQPSEWQVKTIEVLSEGPIYLDGQVYEP